MMLSSTSYPSYLDKRLVERGEAKTFDPLYCAALHNAIVQHIIALDPECASHVVRNVFEAPHANVCIDWSRVHAGLSNTTQGECPEPSSDAQLKERLGELVTTFLENIDIIVFPGYGSYPPETRFLPQFNTPTLGTLFDFAGDVHDPEGEWGHLRNIISLYPCPDTYMGIAFDTFTGIAMCMDADDMMHNTANQNYWVPLDFILRAWLRRFERGHFYVDGQLRERFYVRADLEDDVQAWEEYLEVLESKVRQVSDVAADLEQVDIAGNSLALVHPNLVRLAYNKLNPVSAALLCRLRRPKYGIKHIGPGLVCYDDDLFSGTFGATKLTDDIPAVVSEPGSGKTISTSSDEMFPPADWERDRENRETLSTLLFPAVGPNSGPVTKPYGGGTHRPGMRVSDSSWNPPKVEVLDHEGKTDIFIRKLITVPWGEMYYGNPLSYMLKAFKTMLLEGHWTVNKEGIAGDFTWFAENRDIVWDSYTVLGCLTDADGDELEIGNPWVEDLLPSNTGAIEEAAMEYAPRKNFLAYPSST